MGAESVSVGFHRTSGCSVFPYILLRVHFFLSIHKHLNWAWAFIFVNFGQGISYYMSCILLMSPTTTTKLIKLNL